MKSVLISIQPYYVFLIIARLMGWNIPQDKTVEMRKDFPKDSAWNRVVHIYCSKSKKSFNRIPKEYQPLMAKLLGKVVGEFVCDKINRIGKRGINDNFDYCFLSLNKWGNDDIEIEIKVIKKSCLTKEELNNYGKNSHELYGWHISDLKIYDKPKELGEFMRCQCKYLNENTTLFCDCYCEYFDRRCYEKGGAFIPLTRPPQSWMYIEEMNE